MKRTYDTGEAKDIVFFTGVEVEKTPAFGMKTLFVTGVQDYYAIRQNTLAKNVHISSLVLITVTTQLTQMTLISGMH